MKKKILARAGTAVTTGALIAGMAVSPAFAIRRIDTENCGADRYLVLHSGQPTCWADAGRIADLNLYGVTAITSGNNTGSIRSVNDKVYQFFRDQYKPIGRVHVTVVSIY